MSRVAVSLTDLGLANPARELRSILVPLDGSELSERALAYATALSISTGARIRLVRVVVATDVAFVPETVADSAMERAEDYLMTEATRLRTRGFEIESGIRVGNSVAAAVLQEVKESGADLIVMTSHGRTGPAHWILGSVAEGIIAEASVPVLVERAWQPVRRELLLEDQPRLLVPIDPREFDLAAIVPALGLAADLGGELRILTVWPAADALAESTAASKVSQVVEAIRSEWPAVPVHAVLRRGDPSREILAFAAETNTALVVMASHGRRGLGRLRKGSVAGQVLAHGTIPVAFVQTTRSSPGSGDGESAAGPTVRSVESSA